MTPKTGGKRPFYADGVLTTADFFPMFDTPFQYGSGWSANDDDNLPHVVGQNPGLGRQ